MEKNAIRIFAALLILECEETCIWIFATIFHPVAVWLLIILLLSVQAVCSVAKIFTLYVIIKDDMAAA